jgi:hypothetical protein
MFQFQFKFEVWSDENKYHFGYVLDGKRVSLIQADSENQLEALIVEGFAVFRKFDR